MRLAKAEDVINRLNLQGTVGTANAGSIESALEAATSIVESILRTSLRESERIDYFDYAVGRFSSFHPFTLWLSQGYLASPPSVYFSKDGSPIVSIADAELVDSANVLYDAAKGKVTVTAEPTYYGNSVVAVRYEAGFQSESSDIPYFIQEAAIAAAIYIIHTQSVAHGKKDQKDMSGPLSSIVYSTLNEHIFTPYNGEYPVSTQEL